MTRFELGPLVFQVEARSVPHDRGSTLRVIESRTGHERLRFDCFERAPHWHLDPDGANEIARLDREGDPIAWTIAELDARLEAHLKRAGLELAAPLETGPRATLLRGVEAALRNPPLDLDALDLDALRARRGEKWRTMPEGVLPAWVADMDFPVAEPIARALRAMLRRSDLGYPVNPRPGDALTHVFAERMATRFGWDVNPPQVEVLTDVVQGITLALLSFADAGDGVIVQTPIYPPFLGTVRETRRRLVENPLALGSRGYEMDLDALRRDADAGTRVLLLCNPHNPTGRVFGEEELRPLAELAVARDWMVVADEIHADLVYPGHRHVPFATLGPEVAARTLTLTSATKAFNIAGLRCAVAVFGSDALRQRFRALPRHVRGGLNSPGLVATEAAWRFAQPWLDQVLGLLDRNRRFVAEFVRKRLPRVGHHAPEGTYLAWLDCRSLGLGDDPAGALLEQARVALSDGRAFGAPGRGFVRLNFATSRALLTEILERIAGALGH